MNKHIGSTFESFLDEMGDTAVVTAMATRKALRLQIAQRMQQIGMDKTRLAQRMHTSRSQIHRILSEEDSDISINTLFQLAHAIGLPLHVGFAQAPKPKRRQSAAYTQARR